MASEGLVARINRMKAASFADAEHDPHLPGPGQLPPYIPIEHRAVEVKLVEASNGSTTVECYYGGRNAEGRRVLYLNADQLGHDTEFPHPNCISGFTEGGNFVIIGSAKRDLERDNYIASTIRNLKGAPIGDYMQYVCINDQYRRCRVRKIASVMIDAEDGPVRVVPIVEDGFRVRLSEPFRPRLGR